MNNCGNFMENYIETFENNMSEEPNNTQMEDQSENNSQVEDQSENNPQVEDQSENDTQENGNIDTGNNNISTDTNNQSINISTNNLTWPFYPSRPKIIHKYPVNIIQTDDNDYNIDYDNNSNDNNNNSQEKPDYTNYIIIACLVAIIIGVFFHKKLHF